jgi:hypothetical protein
MSDYPVDELRAPTWQETARNFVSDIFPGRATTDYLSGGRGSADVVGDLAGDIAGPIGKLGAMAKGLPALAAGFVDMGGKRYNNWFYHRTIPKEKEFTWWDKIFDQGLKTEKPASLYNPQTYQVAFDAFGRGPGLLFNVAEHEMPWIGWRDFWSRRVDGVRSPKEDPFGIGFGAKAIEDLAPKLGNWLTNKIGEDAWGKAMYYPGGGFTVGKQYPYGRHTAPESVVDVIDTANNMLKRAGNYNMKKWMSGRYEDRLFFPEKWEPGNYDRLLDDTEPSIEKILSNLLEDINKEKFQKTTNRTINDESIIRVGEDNLAGVRIHQGGNSKIDNIARGFAEEHNVPVYETEAIKNIYKQKKAIQGLLERGVNSWFLD